jgi:hypothetical protein
LNRAKIDFKSTLSDRLRRIKNVVTWRLELIKKIVNLVTRNSFYKVNKSSNSSLNIVYVMSLPVEIYSWE